MPESYLDDQNRENDSTSMIGMIREASFLLVSSSVIVSSITGLPALSVNIESIAIGQKPIRAIKRAAP